MFNIILPYDALFYTNDKILYDATVSIKGEKNG